MSLAQCFEQSGKLIKELQQSQLTTYSEFLDLEMAVFRDLHGRSNIPFNEAINYDTPYWNDTQSDVIHCIGSYERCYTRSQINYFAQGMIAAARGESEAMLLAKTYAWKGVNYGVYPHDNVIAWASYGYERYFELLIQESNEAPFCRDLPISTPPILFEQPMDRRPDLFSGYHMSRGIRNRTDLDTVLSSVQEFIVPQRR